MFNNLAAEAASLLGGTAPEDVAAATSNHVAGTDPDTLANHLTSGAQNLDTGGLAQLAQSLLGALAKNGHDEKQAQDSGVDTNAASAGDQQNVVALIEHARDNPAALRDAAVNFAKTNPQLLTQIPGLVEGVLGRLRG
jgi:hypothetical protein